MTTATATQGEARTKTTTSAGQRLGSIDAYRGLVMFLMMAEVLAIGAVAKAIPESGFWRFLHHQQEHVEWVGCVLHDLIQPSFSFLVGVALPFSIASRLGRGQSLGGLFGHTMWRAFLLVALGIFLRSIGQPQTYYTFEDTLTQIGLGYPILFLLGLASARWQWSALAVILIGYWAAFALYPAPGPNFDWAAVGVKPDWPHHLQGFAAHWDKNSNAAWAFDVWFLNLFPRKSEFLYNGGGYATLSFIPTLGTMILGLIAGGWLKAPTSAGDKIKRFCIAGVALILLGVLLHALGVCPIVKRIWTPTWTIFSGGWCFLLLAAFYVLIDLQKLHGWFFPLMVIGMNSIAAYCIAHLFDRFIAGSLDTHLGPGFFNVFHTYAPFVRGFLVLFAMWLILLWMYRRKLFLKI